MTSPEPSAAGRVGTIAWQTLSQAARLQLAWLGAACVALGLAGSRGLQDFNFGNTELKFVADFGFGAIGLLSLLLAALATAQLFFDDLEGGIVACVLTRAVRRSEYVVGKWLGVAAVLGAFVGTLTLVLVAVLTWRAQELGAEFSLPGIFLQVIGLLWLKATLVAAMTLFVASYAGSALFASAAGLLAAAIGQLRGFVGGSGVRAWLRLWPDFGVFDIDPLLASGRGLEAAALAGAVGYWLVCVALFGILACHAFARREF